MKHHFRVEGSCEALFSGGIGWALFCVVVVLAGAGIVPDADLGPLAAVYLSALLPSFRKLKALSLGVAGPRESDPT